MAISNRGLSFLFTICCAVCLIVSLIVLFSILIITDNTINIIYQFGDSHSDTGNLIIENPNYFYSRLPYGFDFSDYPPTGRCSDGFLIIDRIVDHYEFPLLDPYLKKDGDFKHGVNFAVAGSTALDSATLAAKNISLPVTNSSLSVQLSWFKSYLKSTCVTHKACKHKLRRALFFMGEIGANDINNALLGGKSMEEVLNLVPEVVQTIKNAVEEIIHLGATRVVIPGNFPIGCMPIYLTKFKTNDSNAYDKVQCIKGLNDLATSQNNQLKQAVHELRHKHKKHVDIVYADYFHALMEILRNPTHYGFRWTQKACCGSRDNAYNFNISKMCGSKDAQVCLNPDDYISWDGIQLTSHTYYHVAEKIKSKIHFDNFF